MVVAFSRRLELPVEHGTAVNAGSAKTATGTAQNARGILSAWNGALLCRPRAFYSRLAGVAYSSTDACSIVHAMILQTQYCGGLRGPRSSSIEP